MTRSSRAPGHLPWCRLFLKHPRGIWGAQAAGSSIWSPQGEPTEETRFQALFQFNLCAPLLTRPCYLNYLKTIKDRLRETGWKQLWFPRSKLPFYQRRRRAVICLMESWGRETLGHSEGERDGGTAPIFWRSTTRMYAHVLTSGLQTFPSHQQNRFQSPEIYSLEVFGWTLD